MSRQGHPEIDSRKHPEPGRLRMLTERGLYHLRCLKDILLPKVQADMSGTLHNPYSSPPTVSNPA